MVAVRLGVFRRSLSPVLSGAHLRECFGTGTASDAMFQAPYKWGVQICVIERKSLANETTPSHDQRFTKPFRTNVEVCYRFRRAVVDLDWYAKTQARQQTLPTPDSRCSTAPGPASHDARPWRGCDEPVHLCQAACIAHPASRQSRGVWHWVPMVGFGPTTPPPLRFGSGPAERP